MKGHSYSHDCRNPGIAAAVSVLAALIALSIGGCAAGQYGRLHRDAEVTRMFTGNDVPTLYRYYFIGRSDLPDAIIGIDPLYRLTSPYWEPVEPNTRDFASKVDFIWRPDIWDRFDPAQGAWILDPQGNRVGIWYSMYPNSWINFKSDDQIEISSPLPPEQGSVHIPNR